MATKKVLMLSVDAPSPVGLNPMSLAPDDRRKSLFPVADSRRSSVFQMGNILSTKKASKKLGKSDKRETSPFQPAINYEPTYRMEPSAKFQSHTVRNILKCTLDERLEEFQYNAKMAPTMSQVLTDEIKERTKQLCMDRYKIIVTVILGEKRDQGVMVTSRCAWEPKFDSYATYSYQNKTIFCTATAYGIYMD
ncbi:dynein light chain Tctex-type 5-B-like [Gigantopelta aegis]|uniref:dynein light chain Tctex-type 5-B-like n=1 Tax=Gigantopelta aegis TaxID=1735272 RepID=UPI001B88BF10|nr:dynein light chain Tctex-type 5-B-like [Gigantopelta aegis]